MTKTTNIVLLSLALWGLMTGCSKDSFDGDEAGLRSAPMVFCLTNGGSSTRGGNVGLETIVKDIRVYGTKGNSGGLEKRIFDNYVLWYAPYSQGPQFENHTQTNAYDWEYVGSYVGSTTPSTGMSDLSAQQDAIGAQRGKYWDYDYDHYYFWAIAKAGQGKFGEGEGTTDDKGRITKYVATVNRTDLTDAQKVLYYAPPLCVKRDDAQVNDGNYQKPVNLVFNRLMSKVRVGFYSAMGSRWYVNNMVFYTAADTRHTSANQVVLMGSLPSTATTTIAYAFTEPFAPTCTVTSANASTETSLNLGGLNYTFSNTKGQFLGTTNTNVSYAQGNMDGNYMAVIPGMGETELTLKCDYTLTSADTEETIEITGAVVTIPAADANWQANYAYTYIFRVDSSLNPITLDAVYKEVASPEVTEKEFD